MKKFTKENLIEFKDTYFTNVPKQEDADLYLDFIFQMADIITKEIAVPEYADICEIIELLIDSDFNKINFYAPFEVENKEENEFTVSVVNASNSQKVWKKTPEISDKLDSIISYLEKNRFKSEEEWDDFCKTLATTGNDIKLTNSNICCPKKLISNCSLNSLQTLKNFIIFEIKISSITAANYRVYGFIDKNHYKIYLIDAYTKNSGQAHADVFFDNFVNKAAKYIESNKLLENLLYNILRGYDMKEEKDVFQELENIRKIEDKEMHAQGFEDAVEKRLEEDIDNIYYHEGYNDGKEYLQQKEIKKAMRADFIKRMLDKGISKDALKRHGLIEK